MCSLTAGEEEMRAHVYQVFDGRAMALLESGHFACSAWELVARAAAPGLCGFSGLCSYPHMRRQPVPPGPSRPHLLGLRKSLERTSLPSNE